VADQSVSVSMNLSDLEGVVRGQFFFWQIFIITLERFNPEWPNLAWYHRWRISIFLGGQPRPHPKGAGLSVPQFLGLPMYTQTVCPTATKSDMVAQLGQECVSCGSSMPPFQWSGATAYTNFWILLHSMKNDNQILHGDRTRCEENFHTFYHDSWRSICLR